MLLRRIADFNNRGLGEDRAAGNGPRVSQEEKDARLARLLRAQDLRERGPTWRWQLDGAPRPAAIVARRRRQAVDLGEGTRGLRGMDLVRRIEEEIASGTSS